MNELHHKEIVEEEKHIKEFVHVENVQLEDKINKMQGDINELKLMLSEALKSKS